MFIILLCFNIICSYRTKPRPTLDQRLMNPVIFFVQPTLIRHFGATFLIDTSIICIVEAIEQKWRIVADGMSRKREAEGALSEAVATGSGLWTAVARPNNTNTKVPIIRLFSTFNPPFVFPPIHNFCSASRFSNFLRPLTLHNDSLKRNPSSKTPNLPIKMKFSTVLATLAPVAFVAATDYTVSVGDGGLTFNPNQITGAAQGDTINFQFKAKNHTVTQSTFASPCTQNGIDSGFMPVAANATQIPQFSVTVQNASAPLWFFCKQTSHCQQGMVFAVNPTPAKTFAMFQAMAMGQTAAANGTTGGTSAGSSGTGTAAGGAGATGSGSSAAPSATGKSGALPKLSFSSSAALLTVAGLVAGLSL